LKKKTNIDVLQHHLVPKMKIMEEKDREKLLKKYGISEKDLPLMLSDDPASKAIGAKPGDIVEIERQEPTGPSVYYRRVVE
jgi:DNA-directed RNA polymerase subunit H